MYIVYLSKDGYDKAAQQFVDDYYRNGDYTSDESGSDEESSDYTSDESGADEESSDSDSDKDEDHKYTYKYKYKYAYKPSDNPAKPSPNPDKPSDNPAKPSPNPDKPSPNPAKPKDKPKDDKQTDQKYSVNCISTGLPGLYFNTDDSSEDERQIVNYDPESKQRYIYH